MPAIASLWFRRNVTQSCEPGLRSRQGVHGELLAQSKLDDRLLRVTSKEGEDRVKQGDYEREGLHGERDPARFLRSRKD